MDDVLSPDWMLAVLRRQRAAERQLRAEQQRLARIAVRLRRIERDGPAPAFEVIVRPIAAQPVASARATLPDDSAFAALLNKIEWLVGRQQARTALPPTVVYHGCEGQAMRVEVAVRAGRCTPGAKLASLITRAARSHVDGVPSPFRLRRHTRRGE